MARVGVLALGIFSGFTLAAAPPKGPSPLHSIPANPDNFPPLPQHYQVLVGGQPGPFYTFNYDTSSKLLSNVSSTTSLGTGPSWVEFDKTGSYMFRCAKYFHKRVWIS